jgi:hypothetical protein
VEVTREFWESQQRVEQRRHQEAQCAVELSSMVRYYGWPYWWNHMNGIQRHVERDLAQAKAST